MVSLDNLVSFNERWKEHFGQGGSYLPIGKGITIGIPYQYNIGSGQIDFLTKIANEGVYNGEVFYKSSEVDPQGFGRETLYDWLEEFNTIGLVTHTGHNNFALLKSSVPGNSDRKEDDKFVVTDAARNANYIAVFNKKINEDENYFVMVLEKGDVEDAVNLLKERKNLWETKKFVHRSEEYIEYYYPAEELSKSDIDKLKGAGLKEFNLQE